MKNYIFIFIYFASVLFTTFCEEENSNATQQKDTLILISTGLTNAGEFKVNLLAKDSILWATTNCICM
ncbi:MAG: hypothetical protein HC896_08250 [Bacteroidales bacterium]|nr:hypothetical protein [Bacteroidales bacterium]